MTEVSRETGPVTRIDSLVQDLETARRAEAQFGLLEDAGEEEDFSEALEAATGHGFATDSADYIDHQLDEAKAHLERQIEERGPFSSEYHGEGWREYRDKDGKLVDGDLAVELARRDPDDGKPFEEE